MSAILGYTDLLLKAAESDSQRVGLEKMRRAGQHMLAVINGVLDLAKVESGQMELDCTHFEIVSLLEDVRVIVGRTAQEKGLQLHQEIVGVPSWVFGDATRLRQALLNLVANAVKFTETGSVLIRVSADQPENVDHTLTIKFAVTDSGIGIAPDKLENLFKPFHQANASTTRQYGGTGLGLSITERLARLMGGEVGVQSEPGLGSTFWFAVPLKAGHTPESLDSGAAHATAGFNVDAKVLVVDDDLFNREIVADMLLTLGVVPHTACNGFEAVSMAQLQHFDLILMDVQMPVVDGLAATRHIRALPGWASTPIIALTANTFIKDTQICLEAGMNDCIAKPIRAEGLLALLCQWVPAPGQPINLENVHG
jgi:CheY-like chemotaxis protein